MHLWDAVAVLLHFLHIGGGTMLERIPDALDQWDKYDAEQCRLMDQLPECDYCAAPITADHYYLINDEIICPDCLDSFFRKEVDNFYD